ncbi:MAG: ATP-binding protein [Bacteroidaceae bacterium]|nr:ATP-binding protein [Bacteroidaceae bacterium]
MTTNPFIVSGYIAEPYFCDREKETEILCKCISNQENVVLTSQRRMGKTKLVEHSIEQETVKGQYIFISIDILHTSTLREFILVFGHAVFSHIAKKSERLTKLFATTMRSLNASFGYDPLQNMPTFDIKLGDILRPEYTLEEIFEYIEKADQRCIIVIDEFQQITKYPEKNIEALLRSHVQKLANANFIFAGSQRTIMEEMFFSGKRPFFMSATALQLEPIEYGKYLSFVNHHFQEAGMQIPEDAVRLAYDTFQGVTLYVQRVMHDVWAEMSLTKEYKESLMQDIIDGYIQECSPRLREQLAFVSESQKELLYAVCHEESVKSITSSAFVKRHGLKSPSAVQAASKKLLEFDLLTKREGNYCIADPLLSIWLKSQFN